jgi:tetratricopeptide (TPR) repeat protein
VAIGVIVGLLAAPVLERALAHQDERRDAMQAWQQIGPAIEAVPWTEGDGPAALLRPDRGVVPFTGREDLMARLRDWCHDPATGSALLLTGAGGVGKTRLARQLAIELAAHGWMCRAVRDGAEAHAVPAAVRFAISRPTLLIIDYAETRSGLSALLTDLASTWRPRIRVLMVARGAGEWWDRLGATDHRIRSVLATAGPVAVGAALADGRDDAGLIRAAAPYFATALGRSVPDRIDPVRISSDRPPVLVLHAAALVAVLRGEEAEPPGTVDISTVLAEMIKHEERYWHGSATQDQLGNLSLAVLRRAVAVACLLPSTSEEDAAALLARVPDLADAPQLLRRRVARWLCTIYPGTRPRWWGSLQPDLLAERHCVDQLASAPDFARQCLTDLDSTQATAALTVLNRASRHHPATAEALGEALRRDLSTLAEPAITVSLATPGQLGSLLADAVADAPCDHLTLTRITHAIPYPTTALAAVDLAAVTRIVSALPADVDPTQEAAWYDTLGVLLTQAGRPDEAVVAAQRAVDIYDALAVTDPGAHLSDLAAALNNLGADLAANGRTRDALAAIQRSVELCEELVRADPERYSPNLASSLNNLGIRLAELGRTEEALAMTARSVTLRERLAAADPQRYDSYLAWSLNNLGLRLAEAGRTPDSLAAAMRAVELREGLAAADPDQHLPDLARSLDNCGARLSELGRAEEALLFTERAADIYERLAAVNPRRYPADLATALNNLGMRLSEQGHAAQALVATGRAVEIYERLAAAAPDRYAAALAAALNNLGVDLTANGRTSDAADAIRRAAEVYEQTGLTGPGPDALGQQKVPVPLPSRTGRRHKRVRTIVPQP